MNTNENVNSKYAKNNQIARQNKHNFSAPTIFDLFSRPLDDFFSMPTFNREHYETIKTNIQDKGDRYQLKAQVPGFNKEDIKVDFNDGLLTISAEHKDNVEKHEKDGFILHECSNASVTRQFEFSDVDAKDITAAYANGELDICLMKQQESAKQSTQIAIH